MNEQLLKFIELCLTDGVITDKEREVIFRKATEYNVDIDECEIILESMIQQKNMSQTITVSKNEIATDVNTEINNSERDSLFREAAVIVVEAQQGSASLLQRKLKLGYNRAGRLIDELENAGIVGEFNGEARKINIPNLESLEHFLASGEIKSFDNQSITNNKKEDDSNLKEFKNKIKQLFSDEKYQELIDEAEIAELLFEDLFEDSFIADEYLWALMKKDIEKAYEEIDRITKITSEKSKIQDSVGMIYAKKGDENNDLNLLKKALQCFQSYDYSSKEFGTKRIKYIQNLLIHHKLKSLGINLKLQEEFKNGNYTKLWKVNCYISEPNYLKGNLKIERWRDSTVNFYVPSNAILNEKNAIAFIKANWNNYKDFICDKSWQSKGFKYDSYSLVDFDKRKIEIIEINEIAFN